MCRNPLGRGDPIGAPIGPYRGPYRSPIGALGPREPLQGGRGQSLRGIKRLQILFSQVPGSGQSVLSQQGMPPSESRTKVLLQPGGVGSPTRGGQTLLPWSV